MRKQTWPFWLIVVGLLLALTVPVQARANLDLTQRLGVGDGTATRPSLAFRSDRDLGLYRIGSDNLGVTIGGTKILDIDGSNMDVTGDLIVSGTITAVGGVVGGTSEGTFADGSAAAPGMAFGSDLDTGFYHIGANNFGMTVAGTKRWDFGAATSALTGILTVSGNCTVGGTFDATGNSTVGGTFDITGDTTVGGTLDVTGATTLVSTCEVTDDFTVNTDKFAVTAADGNTAVAGTFDVTGATTLADVCEVTGDFTVHTNKFTVAASSGNTVVAGTFAVTSTSVLTGNTTVVGTLTNTGATALNGGLACDSTLFTVANDTGVLSSIPTTTTGDAWTLDCSTLTTGDGLLIITDDDLLDTGNHAFNILGGSAKGTTQFNVSKGGVVYTLGKVTATDGLDTGTGFTGTGVSLTAAGAGSFDTTLTVTGLIAGSGGLTLDSTVFTIADTTGVLSSIPTTTTGNAWTLDFSLLTTGDGLLIITDDDTLDTGNHVINILGGSAKNVEQFTVCKGGVVYALGTITGTAGVSSGTGYAGTGVTLTAAGAVQADTTVTAGTSLLVTTTSVLTGDVTIGDGYASAGATFTAATGILECKGAITTDDTLTALDVAIGGGFGDSGVTITSGGAVSIDGALVLASTLTAPIITSVVNDTDTISAATCVGYYGKMVFLTHADNVAVTLEDPDASSPAGTQIDFLLTGDDNLAVVFAPTTPDTLITANSVDSDSVTFASGERMGAWVKFISDGTNWHCFNLGQTTMAVTDTD